MTGRNDLGGNTEVALLFTVLTQSNSAELKGIISDCQSVAIVIWLPVFKEDMMNKPNPGSEEAVAKGCKCPVMDNCRGMGIPITTDEGELQIAFWMSADCPLHGIKDPAKEG